MEDFRLRGFGDLRFQYWGNDAKNAEAQATISIESEVFSTR